MAEESQSSSRREELSTDTIDEPKIKLEEKDAKDEELIRLALHRSPFFTCLDDEQVERFVQAASLKRYKAGENIILEGCVDDFETDKDDGQDEVDNENAIIDPRNTALQQEVATEVHASLDSKAPTSTEEKRELQVKELFSEEGFLLVEKPDELELEGAVTESTTLKDGDRMKLAAKEFKENFEDSLPPFDSQSTTEEDAKTPENSLVTGSTGKSSIADFAKDSLPPQDDPTSSRYLEPPPPKSGVPSYLYIIRKGEADVMYSRNVNPASLGSGTVFGEGGFLFGRQHSASVVATSRELECFVVDATRFRNFVLPSDNMTHLYNKYATHIDENTEQPYMTMQDFINSCLEEDSSYGSGEEDKPDEIPDQLGKERRIHDPLASLRIANTFNILRNDQAHQGKNNASAKQHKLAQQRVSLADYCLFHLLMARPDPEVDITFILMDVNKRGVLFKEDISNFMKSFFEDDSDFVFDMNSEFIQRHFGKDSNTQHSIRPNQFSQFLVDLRREIGQQVFLQEIERHGTPAGYLPPANFVRVLKTACGWRLPDGIADRLEEIYPSSSLRQKNRFNNKNGNIGQVGTETTPSGYVIAERYSSPNTDSTSLSNGKKRQVAHHFTYCDFLAFQEVLSQLPGICNVIDRACEIKKGPVSPDDFKVANRVLGMGGSLSRRQVDIIFQLFDRDGDGYVSHEDTVAVAGAEIAHRLDAVPGRQGTLTFAPPPKYRHMKGQEETSTMANLGKLLQNFSLTSIAGAVGVVALAPLDFVKTRLMNDRAVLGGTALYQNSFDCLQIAIKSEGYFGLYRGLLPQLIAVAPEKAIKLAVNDLLTQSLGINTSGTKSGFDYLQEMLAGGAAGACQLIVSNPIEIVKIRMQLQGETARILKARGFENIVPQSLQAVAKTLGYSGLFTGARACLMRDIPFGAIYFPTYAFLKENLSVAREGRSKAMSAMDLLMAGTLAGVPASFLTTPADVIKTRLQVIPRPGEQRYDGIRDCFTKVYEREGPRAFFRGSAARVAKISPQFGISLVAYEQLSQLLGATGLLPPTTVPVNPNDYWEAFPARKADDKDQLLRKLGTKPFGPGGP